MVSLLEAMNLGQRVLVALIVAQWIILAKRTSQKLFWSRIY